MSMVKACTPVRVKKEKRVHLQGATFLRIREGVIGEVMEDTLPEGSHLSDGLMVTLRMGSVDLQQFFSWLEIEILDPEHS